MNILNLPAWSVLDTRRPTTITILPSSWSYPPRRDGGAFPASPADMRGFCFAPTDQCANIYEQPKAPRVEGLGAVAILG